jgi:DNA-binding NtrC family response regulator
LLENRERVRHLLNQSTQADEATEEALSPQDNAFMTDLYRLMEQELANPELDVTRMTELMHISRTKFYYKVKA